MNVRSAGDRAALIEVADNETARAVARGLRGREHVVDVVPGHCTVLVTWCGERPRLDVEPECDVPYTASHELVVTYDGPDLDDVAVLAACSREEVVARHAAATYVVGFVGFAPGFAYLLGGDERLYLPRLATPRERVPAGSVAVAGPYSGIYPRETPGGWRLLGRTEAVLFDAARTPPALLQPGDRVRFVGG
jgi:KipI family sensor histidine kinase inhibitor